VPNVSLSFELGNKNQIYGAQFCYLMSQTLFSKDSKLGLLLGLSPDGNNVLEATQMTEIYEYATSLAETNFNAGISFLHRKFNYTKSLIDYGFTFKAYSYCEVISKQLDHVDKKSDSFDSLRWSVLQISERLQYCEEAVSRGGQEWITNLRNSLNEILTSEDTSGRDSLTSTQPETPAEPSGPANYNSYPPEPTNFKNQNYGEIPNQQGPISTTIPYYDPTTLYQDPQQPQTVWENQNPGGTENATSYDSNNIVQPTSIPDHVDYSQSQPQDQFYIPAPPVSQKPYETQNGE
jgi:hypothetical protein